MANVPTTPANQARLFIRPSCLTPFASADTTLGAIHARPLLRVDTRIGELTADKAYQHLTIASPEEMVKTTSESVPGSHVNPFCCCARPARARHFLSPLDASRRRTFPEVVQRSMPIRSRPCQVPLAQRDPLGHRRRDCFGARHFD